MVIVSLLADWHGPEVTAGSAEVGAGQPVVTELVLPYGRGQAEFPCTGAGVKWEQSCCSRGRTQL